MGIGGGALDNLSRCFLLLAALPCSLLPCGCAGPQQAADHPASASPTAPVSAADDRRMVKHGEEEEALAAGSAVKFLQQITGQLKGDSFPGGTAMVWYLSLWRRVGCCSLCCSIEAAAV